MPVLDEPGMADTTNAVSEPWDQSRAQRRTGLLFAFTVYEPPSPGDGFDMLAVQVPEGDVAGGDVAGGEVGGGCVARVAGGEDGGAVAGGLVVGGAAVVVDVDRLTAVVASASLVVVMAEPPSCSTVKDVVVVGPAVTLVLLPEPVAEASAPRTMNATVTQERIWAPLGSTRNRRHSHAARSFMGNPQCPSATTSLGREAGSR